MSELIIRSIAKDDVFACVSIYNYEVEHGVATLDLEPRTLEEWREWWLIGQKVCVKTLITLDIY